MQKPEAIAHTNTPSPSSPFFLPPYLLESVVAGAQGLSQVLDLVLLGLVQLLDKNLVLALLGKVVQLRSIDGVLGRAHHEVALVGELLAVLQAQATVGASNESNASVRLHGDGGRGHGCFCVGRKRGLDLCRFWLGCVRGKGGKRKGGRRECGAVRAYLD